MPRRSCGTSIRAGDDLTAVVFLHSGSKTSLERGPQSRVLLAHRVEERIPVREPVALLLFGQLREDVLETAT